MNSKQERAKKAIMKVLNREVSSHVEDFSEKIESIAGKLVHRGKSMNLDLSKIIGLLQSLRIVRRKKIKNHEKKLVLSIIIASIIVTSIGLFLKSYHKIKEGSTAEEKIRIFIESLELDKLKDNPVIAKIRNERIY